MLEVRPYLPCDLAHMSAAGPINSTCVQHPPSIHKPLPLLLLSEEYKRTSPATEVGGEEVKKNFKKQILWITLDQTDTRNKQYSREQQRGLTDTRKEAKGHVPHPDIPIDPQQIWRAKELMGKQP